MSLGRAGDGVRIPVTRRGRERGWRGAGGAQPCPSPPPWHRAPRGDPCTSRGAAARVSHESGCFILLTKTDHRPFQATMKTAARQKRRRASVSICKQNKTRYDERAEGAALGRGSLQATLLDGGHSRGTRAMGKAARTQGCQGWSQVPASQCSQREASRDARLPNVVPAFQDRPCTAPAQGEVCNTSPRPRTTETLSRCGTRHGAEAASTSGPASCTEPNPGCHICRRARIKKQNLSERSRAQADF